MMSDFDAAAFELGRLMQLLDDDGVATIWRPDAIRREAIATLHLDGIGVHGDDLALGLLSPLLPAHGHRPVVRMALDVVRATESLLAGRRAKDDDELDVVEVIGDSAAGDDDDLLPADIEDLDDLIDEVDDPRSEDAVRSAAKATASDLDAFLATLQSGGPLERSLLHSGAAAPMMIPLSTPWLESAWRSIAGPIDEDTVASIAEATIIIDAGLSSGGGLPGAAAALHGLHMDGLFPDPESSSYDALTNLSQRDLEATDGNDEARQKLCDERVALRDALTVAMAERQAAGLGWRFARLVAPWIIQRACGLSQPMPWISEALRQSGRGYASCATGPLPVWQRYFGRMLADGLMSDRNRIIKLRNAAREHDTWLKGRHKDNRAKTVLSALWAKPAAGVKDIKRLGRYKTYRGAQQLIGDLVEAGIIREVTERAVSRVWMLSAIC